MKRIVMAMALTGALSISATAGDMPTTDSPAPIGTPQTITSTSPSPAPSALGDMHGSDSAQPALDGVWSAVLSVLGLVV